MIRAWRAAFGDPSMPFGIISLCTDGPRQTRDNYVELMLDDGVYIREAQYQTFLDFCAAGDQNIGFASSYDQRRSWYHPQLKIPVGERISRWALATQYGMEKQIRWRPPMCTKMQVVDGTIVLHFDGEVAADDTNAAIEGFAIAGEDRRFQPAAAEWLITGQDRNGRPQRDRRALVLRSQHIPAPIHYRYAWGRNPMGNLQSADHNDLPFATQRSDDWKMEEVPLGVLGDESIVGGRLTRQQRARIRDELREDDLRRRLAEARALIEEHGNLDEGRGKK
jgi:sialate O-acetylesterase